MRSRQVKEKLSCRWERLDVKPWTRVQKEKKPGKHDKVKRHTLILNPKALGKIITRTKCVACKACWGRVTHRGKSWATGSSLFLERYHGAVSRQRKWRHFQHLQKVLPTRFGGIQRGHNLIQAVPRGVKQSSACIFLHLLQWRITSTDVHMHRWVGNGAWSSHKSPSQQQTNTNCIFQTISERWRMASQSHESTTQDPFFSHSQPSCEVDETWLGDATGNFPGSLR